MGLAISEAHQVANPNLSLPRSALGHTHATRTLHDHIEVHSIDAGAGIILESKIDVLLDAKAKVPCCAEVLLAQFILLHLEPTLKDLLGLLASHCDVAGDLLVTSNAKGTHSEACCVNNTFFCYLNINCVIGTCEEPRTWISAPRDSQCLSLYESEGLHTFGENRLLPTQLLQHFCSTSQPVTTLADGYVQNQLLDLELTHGVCVLLIRRHLCHNSSMIM